MCVSPLPSSQSCSCFAPLTCAGLRVSMCACALASATAFSASCSDRIWREQPPKTVSAMASAALASAGRMYGSGGSPSRSWRSIDPKTHWSKPSATATDPTTACATCQRARAGASWPGRASPAPIWSTARAITTSPIMPCFVIARSCSAYSLKAIATPATARTKPAALRPRWTRNHVPGLTRSRRRRERDEAAASGMSTPHDTSMSAACTSRPSRYLLATFCTPPPPKRSASSSPA
mmetsp:Transcript_7113/g.23574  ORF Transcript_7113/g.23574 Transcript_7113/m.23574 type:complete len:236 (+) Transcript_7113:767-1474(+)